MYFITISLTTTRTRFIDISTLAQPLVFLSNGKEIFLREDFVYSEYVVLLKYIFRNVGIDGKQFYMNCFILGCAILIIYYSRQGNYRRKTVVFGSHVMFIVIEICLGLGNCYGYGFFRRESGVMVKTVEAELGLTRWYD